MGFSIGGSYSLLSGNLSVSIIEAAIYSVISVYGVLVSGVYCVIMMAAYLCGLFRFPVILQYSYR
jgi:hypothetical protein